jgi:hypothetical protein
MAVANCGNCQFLDRLIAGGNDPRGTARQIAKTEHEFLSSKKKWQNLSIYASLLARPAAQLHQMPVAAHLRATCGSPLPSAVWKAARDLPLSDHMPAFVVGWREARLSRPY